MSSAGFELPFEVLQLRDNLVIAQLGNLVSLSCSQVCLCGFQACAELHNPCVRLGEQMRHRCRETEDKERKRRHTAEKKEKKQQRRRRKDAAERRRGERGEETDNEGRRHSRVMQQQTAETDIIMREGDTAELCGTRVMQQQSDWQSSSVVHLRRLFLEGLTLRCAVLLEVV